MNEIININGVECYEKDGTAYLKLETVARGLGFTTVAKSGNEVVRWNTVQRYLDIFGVATSCNDTSYRHRCPEYIPENIFYRLCMKAKNETAEKFQALVADEVIPSIRKTGGYMTGEAQRQMLNQMQGMLMQTVAETVKAVVPVVLEHMPTRRRQPPTGEHMRTEYIGARMTRSEADVVNDVADRLNLSKTEVLVRGAALLKQQMNGGDR